MYKVTIWVRIQMHYRSYNLIFQINFPGRLYLKNANESETILVDRHTVSGNYPVIFQVLAFQKVIHKRRQIHCLHC